MKSSKGTTVITTDVAFRIGILKESLAKVRPSIISEFFTSGEEGLLWINVPVTNDSSELTADIADRILSLDIDR